MTTPSSTSIVDTTAAVAAATTGTGPQLVDATKSRVLSVQSTVVYGRVGNKASLFPMQLLGIEVDPINSCQFSNHTGYPSFTGSKTPASELTALVSGLEKNGFLKEYTDILTGYMSSIPFLEEFVNCMDRFLKANPRLFYLCDPVLGDEGKLYVPAEFTAIYRDKLIRHAAVITPNQTEATFLSGIAITKLEDGIAACNWFHEQRGVATVIITSMQLSTTHIDVLASTRDASLVSEEGKSAGPYVYHVQVPRVAKYYSGCGDLTSSLLLTWLKADRNLKSALEKTLASVAAVIKRTHEAGVSELMLSQSKADLEHPPASFTVARWVASSTAAPS